MRKLDKSELEDIKRIDNLINSIRDIIDNNNYNSFYHLNIDESLDELEYKIIEWKSDYIESIESNDEI